MGIEGWRWVVGVGVALLPLTVVVICAERARRREQLAAEALRAADKLASSARETSAIALRAIEAAERERALLRAALVRVIGVLRR